MIFTFIDLTAKLRVLTLSQWDSSYSTLPDGLKTNDRPDWSFVYRNGFQNVTQALRWVSNPIIRLLRIYFNQVFSNSIRPYRISGHG